jgi:hypothetical protein
MRGVYEILRFRIRSKRVCATIKRNRGSSSSSSSSSRLLVILSWSLRSTWPPCQTQETTTLLLALAPSPSLPRPRSLAPSPSLPLSLSADLANALNCMLHLRVKPFLSSFFEGIVWVAFTHSRKIRCTRDANIAPGDSISGSKCRKQRGQVSECTHVDHLVHSHPTHLRRCTGEQGLPPSFAAWIARGRLTCQPSTPLALPLIFAWSQLIEHSLHAVGKISTQSTGEQACSLHFRFSTRSHFCNRSMLA